MKIILLIFIWLVLFNTSFSQVLEEVILRPNSLSEFDMFATRLILNYNYPSFEIIAVI